MKSAEVDLTWQVALKFHGLTNSITRFRTRPHAPGPGGRHGGCPGLGVSVDIGFVWALVQGHMVVTESYNLHEAFIKNDLVGHWSRAI